jgi:hypothetical protein
VRNQRKVVARQNARRAYFAVAGFIADRTFIDSMRSPDKHGRQGRAQNSRVHKARKKNQDFSQYFIPHPLVLQF